MARAIPGDLADRRRQRLALLIEAIGEVRGQRITQRDFSSCIGREQGTIAAILGGHRALGGDVLGAIVSTWRLPTDCFDAELTPDFATLLRREEQSEPPRPIEPRSPSAVARSVPVFDTPTELAEVLDFLVPDRPVSMALRWLARRGHVHDADGWASQAVAAQSASERGELSVWLDDFLMALAARGSMVGSDVAGSRMAPRTMVAQGGTSKSSRLSRA